MRTGQLICVFIITILNCYTSYGTVEKVKLHMPGVRPKKDDSYICTSFKLPSGDSYIVKYEPNAHKETAHHMLLFGCVEPGRESKAWNCGDMGSGTCRGSETILFGWARDAPSLQLPKDVGFKVGGETGVRYLTLQIHYAHALEASHYDRSGLTIHMTSAPQLNLASIYLLVAVSANIPPHSQGIHVDIACKYNSDQDIKAFAFRTHAHDLGRVITGYRVRNDSWTLLGKGDPHAPQAFYPMHNVTTIKKGDILAARCTYDTINSGKTKTTRIGSTASDEMCNFYMMYYRDANSNIATPEVCADQYTYVSLYDSFPNGSDVAPHSTSGHHHHHFGHKSNLKEDTEKTENIVPNIKKPGTNQAFPTTSSQESTTETTSDEIQTTESPGIESMNGDKFSKIDDDVTTVDEPAKDEDSINVDDITTTRDYQQTREMTTGSPMRETTYSTHVKTSRSVTHDVTSDVTTSTSVSEQTTTPSELIFKVSSTSMSFKFLKTARPSVKVSKNNGIQQSEVRPSENTKSKKFNVSIVESWPSGVTDGLGQVTGIAVDSSGRLFVFHRGERDWDYDTFSMDNRFRNPQARGPIRDPTILILDGNNGKVLAKHGEDMFYLPHGLTIDHQDNVWVTDVGRHQVLKFPSGEFEKPNLVLGEYLVPGSDHGHFCKPTDVAVEKSGVFYVSDGYCNGRIMKFSREGRLLKVWGRPSLRNDPRPTTFNIPHSLTLDEKRNMLYVADRENGRIQCFDTEGTFHKEISSQKFGGLVFAVDFNNKDNVLYAVNSGGKAKVQGFAINPNTGNIISTWSPHDQGFSQPHAIVSNGSSVYVAEIGPNRVWKFERLNAVPSNDQNFARGLNAAVLESNPTKASDGPNTDSPDGARKKPEASHRTGVIILAILSVPVVILLVVGLVSRVTRRRHRMPKYDMMDSSLGSYSPSGNWCNSMNCCNRPYRNMEELYLMDSDSDLEIYPDVHVDKR